MVDYKIVKYCRNCKKRFLVQKGKAKIIFCKDCQKKVNHDVEEKK